MRTIKKDGKSKLVEYEEAGESKRVVLPTNEEDINLGIPYGFPFAEALTEKIGERMAGLIEQELHKAEIWTPADIMKNPAAAQGAVLSAYGVDYAILLELAKQFKEV